MFFSNICPARPCVTYIFHCSKSISNIVSFKCCVLSLSVFYFSVEKNMLMLQCYRCDVSKLASFLCWTLTGLISYVW